jgi:4'-phosphopantetheinyl transferase
MTIDLHKHLPGSTFLLGASQAHVWQTGLSDLPANLERLQALLSADELERAGRFVFERDRWRYTAARAGLRLLLGAYLNCDPASIRFSYNQWGKPALADGFDEQLYFNLAHSQDMAVYVFTRQGPTGIDLEYVRPFAEHLNFSRMFFSERENNLLASLCEADRLAVFYKLWTCKEAYLKAIGDGLAGELKDVEVDLTPGLQPRFRRMPGMQSYQLELFRPFENFQGALVTDTSCSRPDYRTIEGYFNV